YVDNNEKNPQKRCLVRQENKEQDNGQYFNNDGQSTKQVKPKTRKKSIKFVHSSIIAEFRKISKRFRIDK
ncbi:hypothetical protein IAG15_19820, partial [Enterococcus faecalis]|nr:hypothetical protein [Enterococcus faecalis]